MSYQNSLYQDIEVIYNVESNKYEVVDRPTNYWSYLVGAVIFTYYCGIFALLIIYYDSICACGCAIWLWSLINWAMSLTVICYVSYRYENSAILFDGVLLVLTVILIAVKSWGVYIFITKDQDCNKLTLLWLYNAVNLIDMALLIITACYKILVLVYNKCVELVDGCDI
jgi:hypothetical protein